MGKVITVAIAGLGSRGYHTYGQLAAEYSDLKIVAIADIIPEKVQIAAKEFGIPPEGCFNSAEEMLAQPKLADAMFIATMDRQHWAQAIAALNKGYHLLLEKPISPVLEECTDIARVANKNNLHVVVCHVLRYTPFYQTLKKIVDSGRIGEIATIQAIENVGYGHQAHSFVRGNWRNSVESSPMILQKSCHDLDVLLWLSGRRCEKISSYGNIFLFKESKAPKGATKFCLDGCSVKSDCIYDAEKHYLTNARTGYLKGNTHWPANVLTTEPSEEKIVQALKTGPYGRCVYYCDNDVVDHQVVNMIMDNGMTTSFTMTAFTATTNRNIKIMGTLGEIVGDMDGNEIVVSLFGKDSPEVIRLEDSEDEHSGHGGGDRGIMEDFISLLADKNGDKKKSLSSVDVSVQSHVMAFAAEESRKTEGRSIDINSFSE